MLSTVHAKLEQFATLNNRKIFYHYCSRLPVIETDMYQTSRQEQMKSLSVRNAFLSAYCLLILIWHKYYKHLLSIFENVTFRKFFKNKTNRCKINK